MDKTPQSSSPSNNSINNSFSYDESDFEKDFDEIINSSTISETDSFTIIKSCLEHDLSDISLSSEQEFILTDELDNFDNRNDQKFEEKIENKEINAFPLKENDPEKNRSENSTNTDDFLNFKDEYNQDKLPLDVHVSEEIKKLTDIIFALQNKLKLNDFEKTRSDQELIISQLSDENAALKRENENLTKKIQGEREIYEKKLEESEKLTELNNTIKNNVNQLEKLHSKLEKRYEENLKECYKNILEFEEIHGANINDESWKTKNEEIQEEFSLIEILKEGLRNTQETRIEINQKLTNLPKIKPSELIIVEKMVKFEIEDKQTKILALIMPMNLSLEHLWSIKNDEENPELLNVKIPEELINLQTMLQQCELKRSAISMKLFTDLQETILDLLLLEEKDDSSSKNSKKAKLKLKKSNKKKEILLRCNYEELVEDLQILHVYTHQLHEKVNILRKKTGFVVGNYVNSKGCRKEALKKIKLHLNENYEFQKTFLQS